MGNYKKLNVWIKAKNMAVQIYKFTEQGSFKNDFRFKDQIRAAAISVASNIAEGDELQTNKQAINFFFIAKGSTAEVITQIYIATEIGYLDIDTSESLINEYEHISHMLSKLISVRREANL